MAKDGVRILRIIEYKYETMEQATEDKLRWLNGFSRKGFSMRSASLLMEAIEWDEPNALALDGPFPGHRQNCRIWKRHPHDYEMGNPDSEQHCSSCHCSCDPDGPTCGHTAGCPGC